MMDNDKDNGTLLLLLLKRRLQLCPGCLSREEVLYFGEMAGRMAEKRTIVIVTDALAVGSSLSTRKSCDVGHMKEEEDAPNPPPSYVYASSSSISPPPLRDGASDAVDDGGEGDDDDGVARSKRGIVASVVVVDDNGDGNNGDGDGNPARSGREDFSSVDDDDCDVAVVAEPNRADTYPRRLFHFHTLSISSSSSSSSSLSGGRRRTTIPLEGVVVLRGGARGGTDAELCPRG
jgi:hypothetical protein